MKKQITEKETENRKNRYFAKSQRLSDLICPLCGSSKISRRTLIRIPEASVLTCRNCGFVWEGILEFSLRGKD